MAKQHVVHTADADHFVWFLTGCFPMYSLEWRIKRYCCRNDYVYPVTFTSIIKEARRLEKRGKLHLLNQVLELPPIQA